MKSGQEIALEDVAVSSAAGMLEGAPVRLQSPMAVSRPTRFILDRNWPNPFHPSTLIRFGLPREAAVSFDLFDVTGRRIKKLVDNEVYPAGWHTIHLDGTGLASGVYFCRMKAGDFEGSRKLVLMR
jgi:hypothetical protein